MEDTQDIERLKEIKNEMIVQLSNIKDVVREYISELSYRDWGKAAQDAMHKIRNILEMQD